jgi:acyl carrier protein
LGGFSVIPTETIVTFLHSFFAERGVILPNHWAKFNFIQAGVLDSFEILTLIVSLETHFSLTIPAEMLADPENAELGRFASALQELT